MPPYIQSFRDKDFSSKPRRRHPLWNLFLFGVILLTATGYSYMGTLVEHPRTTVETALQMMVNAGLIFSVALVGRLAEKVWR